MPKHVNVVVAVIEDERRGVLISKRRGGQHLAGLWEFPGGKVEPGEALHDALARELREELGIVVTRHQALCEIHHDYPEKSVALHVFLVSQFSGEAIGCEGQEVRWVDRSSLSDYTFPPANTPILDRLCGDT